MLFSGDLKRLFSCSQGTERFDNWLCKAALLESRMKSKYEKTGVRPFKRPHWPTVGPNPARSGSGRPPSGPGTHP